MNFCLNLVGRRFADEKIFGDERPHFFKGRNHQRGAIFARSDETIFGAIVGQNSAAVRHKNVRWNECCI